VTADVLRTSALAHRAADLAQLRAAEVPFLAQVDVRTGLPSALWLPEAPNTALRSGDRSLLWLGPDEWLVTSGTESAPSLVAEVATALAGTHHAAVDVSANRVAIDLLDGPDVLRAACGLDLHPRAWADGMCAQTLFARAQVLLEQRGAATRVFVRPSFADYLIDRLLAG